MGRGPAPMSTTGRADQLKSIVALFSVGVTHAGAQMHSSPG